jgi:hypothetical protein
MKLSISTLLFLFTSITTAQPLIQLEDSPDREVYDVPAAEELQAAEQELQELFGGERLEPGDFVIQQSLTERYSHIDPNGEVPRNLLNQALAAYDQNQAGFTNRDYISVMDFSTRSNKVRYWVINMETGSVWSVRTTHGAGGDPDHDGFVDEVSNISGSHMSSKGFYRVAEIYYGKYGRSVRLDGLSSTNSRARPRAIVIHGGDYVQEANVIQGRSWGCFVFAWSVKDQVIDRIAGGSLLYADFSE